MISAVLVVFAQSTVAVSTSAPPEPTPSVAIGPPSRPPFEFTAQLVMGGGARFRPTLMPEGFFALQWRLDFLFGRTSPRAFGIGPALSVRMDHFSDIAPMLGASVLFPIHEALPIVLTAAGGARWDGTTWAPGVSGRAWWGVRSHNYHGVYVLCVGLWAETRHWFEPQNSTDFAVGIDFDMQALAIPFIALYVEVFRRTRNH